MAFAPRVTENSPMPRYFCYLRLLPDRRTVSLSNPRVPAHRQISRRVPIARTS
ncbi:hypothetical protein C8T65DRAFT_664060 [Cerioporus squamosus]|nr:hypothetical protein C8T65DRAFT_664060 [Cerioporus squamosus]